MVTLGWTLFCLSKYLFKALKRCIEVLAFFKKNQHKKNQNILTLLTPLISVLISHVPWSPWITKYVPPKKIKIAMTQNTHFEGLPCTVSIWN